MQCVELDLYILLLENIAYIKYLFLCNLIILYKITQSLHMISKFEFTNYV